MTPPSQLNPSNSQASNQPSLGQSMFGGDQEQPSQQPQEAPDPTGMAKAVAGVRSSLMNLSQAYPEFSQISDKFISALVDQMYQSMTKQDTTKEGKEMSY